MQMVVPWHCWGNVVLDLVHGELESCLNTMVWEVWVVKKLSDLEMGELRRIKDSTVLPLNLAVKTLLLP
jgi:hypothetical protein